MKEPIQVGLFFYDLWFYQNRLSRQNLIQNRNQVTAFRDFCQFEVFIIIVKYQPYIIVKHTLTIRWQEPTNCLSVLDHFMGLAQGYWQ